ncbi:MAG: haloacetate dehalogenase [Thermomicrobiales bacterium]|jgi:pimeloyl-ACP methyl ester carboxylesterase|nr:haloacetate dehalogenase [Thermomicrobiales bacterium]
MLEGFTVSTIDTGEAVIRVRHGGSAPPLLLLHGHPQAHVMWHEVAPLLARDFTVVAADLRGYGNSSKPPTTPDHEPYSKRAMARDQVAVMRQLGFEQFFVAGHDRGGRCAYRMARSTTRIACSNWRCSTSSRRARPSVAPKRRSGLATGTGSSWRNPATYPSG